MFQDVAVGRCGHNLELSVKRYLPQLLKHYGKVFRIEFLTAQGVDEEKPRMPADTRAGANAKQCDHQSNLETQHLAFSQAPERVALTTLYDRHMEIPAQGDLLKLRDTEASSQIRHQGADFYEHLRLVTVASLPGDFCGRSNHCQSFLCLAENWCIRPIAPWLSALDELALDSCQCQFEVAPLAHSFDADSTTSLTRRFQPGSSGVTGSLRDIHGALLRQEASLKLGYLESENTKVIQFFQIKLRAIIHKACGVLDTKRLLLTVRPDVAAG